MLNSLSKHFVRVLCFVVVSLIVMKYVVAEETAKPGDKKDEAVKEEAKPVDVK